MRKEQLDVADFHRAMNQGILPSPGVPDATAVRLRGHLVAEEFFEFLEAIFDGRPDDLREAKIRVAEIVTYSMFKINMVGIAKEIADLKYVLEGTNLAFGIDGEPIWDAVHASNMEKSAGEVSPEGKRLKPPGWEPPDIAGLLQAQHVKEI